jgi:alkanesulfonate monooxygenase SsuD/methylene tetrahydromethanopterin reductase-like flavin-dependent oxidoreductase (luciferase family)
VEAGRQAGTVEFGMQFWMGVAADRASARDLVAKAMGSTYRLPFERFEKYTPYGTAAQVAEFIAPYVDAGCRHVNLIPAQPTLEENVERAADVQQALRSFFRG